MNTLPTISGLTYHEALDAHRCPRCGLPHEPDTCPGLRCRCGNRARYVYRCVAGGVGEYFCGRCIRRPIRESRDTRELAR